VYACACVYVRVRVCVRVRACMRACACVRARVCMRACACMRAWVCMPVCAGMRACTCMRECFGCFSHPARAAPSDTENAPIRPLTPSVEEDSAIKDDTVGYNIVFRGDEEEKYGDL
jgi:hypothetical protein